MPHHPTVAGRQPATSPKRGRRALAVVPDPESIAVASAQAEARARAILEDAEASTGAPLLTRSGRCRSPITLPEYRMGRPAANKGKRYPVEVLTP